MSDEYTIASAFQRGKLSEAGYHREMDRLEREQDEPVGRCPGCGRVTWLPDLIGRGCYRWLPGASSSCAGVIEPLRSQS